MRSIPFLVERHAEEAAFLWLQRRRAVHASHFDLSALKDLDERLEAHLDGLRVAGETGWRVARQAMLDFQQPGEIFAATVLGLDSREATRIEDLLAIVSLDANLVQAAASAFGWLPKSRVAGLIARLSSAGSSRVRQLGITAAAVHRIDPGPALARAMDDEDVHLSARALRAAGELGRVDLSTKARAAFSTDVTTKSFWAAWSRALLARDKHAIGFLQSVCEHVHPCQENAARMVCPLLDVRTANAWCHTMSENSQSRRIGVISAGILGDPDAIPWVLDLMKEPTLARVAGEAHRWITGLDLTLTHLKPYKAEAIGHGPTEGADQENVGMDPDQNLPWPDSALVHKWWNRNRSRFQTGIRYLLGEPITIERCRRVLRIGRQRERTAAALELAIRQPGQPLFEVRAPGFRQQALLE